ncbi:hypothetical protein, partial [Pseudovibrio exalbescens]|uniref:hypothetical protein n=1 Tax=Pseudovibrio exalbescens TaxID=197461 RepID=UPI000564CE74
MPDSSLRSTTISPWPELRIERPCRGFGLLPHPPLVASFVIPRLTRDPVGWRQHSPGLVALDAGSA